MDFLKTLPTLHDSESQRAFIFHAGLDRELQAQIPFGKPVAEFVPLLVSTLLNYEKLQDGRDAIIAILETAEHYIGKDRQVCSKPLIQKIHSQKQAIADSGNDNILSQIRQKLLITRSSHELTENLYQVEAYLSTDPYNIEAKLLKDKIIQAIKNDRLNSTKPSVPEPATLPFALLVLIVLLYFFMRWLWGILF